MNCVCCNEKYGKMIFTEKCRELFDEWRISFCKSMQVVSNKYVVCASPTHEYNAADFSFRTSSLTFFFCRNWWNWVNKNCERCRCRISSAFLLNFLDNSFDQKMLKIYEYAVWRRIDRQWRDVSSGKKCDVWASALLHWSWFDSQCLRFSYYVFTQ